MQEILVRNNKSCQAQGTFIAVKKKKKRTRRRRSQDNAIQGGM